MVRFDASSAPATALAANTGLAGRVDAYLTAQEQAHRFSGAVVVARGDTVLLSKGYGAADWTRQLPNTAHTSFPLRAFDVVGPAIQQLEDAGKLHDGDSICRYILHCPTAWAPITLAALLDETSGLHDYANDTSRPSIEGKPYSLAGLVDYIAGEPLDAAPGKVCCSANPDIPVEEEIVQRVSGMSFGAYLQRHILSPLGLEHTGYYANLPPRQASLAAGYMGWQQPAFDDERYDTSSFGGMLYTSAADYARLDQALFAGRLLSAASTVKLTTTSHTLVPPADRGFGMTQVGSTGLGAIVTHLDGHTIIWYGYTIGTIGMGAAGLYIPDQHIVVTAFDNDISAAPADLLAQLLTRVLST